MTMCINSKRTVVKAGTVSLFLESRITRKTRISRKEEISEGLVVFYDAESDQVRRWAIYRPFLVSTYHDI